MDVSKSQKISFRIMTTLVMMFLCVALATPLMVKGNWLTDKWEAVKSAVGTACKVVSGWVSGDSGSSEEPETVEAAVSFEDVGQMAALYFSTNSSPSTDTGNIPGVGALNSTYNDGSEVIAGNAGVFVAFGGKSWLSSLLTSSVTSASYDTYNDVKISSSGQKSSDVYNYASYGAVLSTAGLDKTGYERIQHFGNMITGGLIYVLYLLSIGMVAFFKIIFDVLIALNPFTLFYKGVNNMSTSANFHMDGIATNTTAGKTANVVFAGLIDFLSRWYTGLANFSWQVIVPILFLCLGVSIVLFRHTGKWKSQLKKYVIRICFLVIGVPLLGGVYTKALEDMHSFLDAGSSPATKLIMSTFVDFESWAEHGRLSLNKVNGDSMKLVATEGSKGARIADGNTKLNVRNIAYQINKAYSVDSGSRSALGDALFMDYTGGGESTNSSNKSTDVDTDYASSSSRDKTDVVLVNDDRGNKNSRNSLISSTTGMLVRYMFGKYYTPGEYEALAKAQLTSWANSKEQGNHIIIQFMTIKDLASWYVSTEGDCYESHRGRLTDLGHFGTAVEKDSSHDDLLVETSGSENVSFDPVNIYANGGIQFYASGTNGYYTETAPAVPTWLSSQSSVPYTVDAKYGLSSCSMYNYLNTAFSTTSVTCYSPSNIASSFIRQSHFSVNIVGTGITSALYWLNCFMMLLCYIVVGYFYAVGMLFSNVSRMFQVIKAVPFALLGAIKSIAEVITYALVMILEIILTIFLFEVIIEIMFSLPDIFTGTLAAGFQASGSNTLVNWGMPVILIFLVFFYGWFMVKALKMRKKFIKAMAEAAEGVVDKFLDVKTDVVTGGTPGPGHGKSVIGGAVGGAAAGLGAAMAGNMMTKDAARSDDSGNSNNGSDGPSDGSMGPDGGGDHGNGIVAGGNGASVNASDVNMDNSKDTAQIDNPESKMDALDKKQAGAIGMSLADSNNSDADNGNGDKADKKSIGERLGENEENRGRTKEVRGLNKEADGLDQEAKGDSRKAKGEDKLEASKDLKKKAVKDGTKGAAMSAMGKAGMMTPGMRLAGAGMYVAGKAQQIKSVGELAAAKAKETSGKHDVKAGEKQQAKGQKMQAKGQAMQKKGVDVQTSGQTKKVKAQNARVEKANNKAAKTERRQVKNQEPASAIAKRSQSESLRTTANAKSVKSNTNQRPSSMSGKQARSQSVQTQNKADNRNGQKPVKANTQNVQAQQTQAQPQQTSRKQSLTKAAINGARQGANQAMANRSDEGSIRQQFFQGRANGYAQNQMMENYHQRYGNMNQNTRVAQQPQRVQTKPVQQKQQTPQVVQVPTKSVPSVSQKPQTVTIQQPKVQTIQTQDQPVKVHSTVQKQNVVQTSNVTVQKNVASESVTKSKPDAKSLNKNTTE